MRTIDHLRERLRGVKLDVPTDIQIDVVGCEDGKSVLVEVYVGRDKMIASKTVTLVDIFRD
jgi:hypothetical protein